MRYIEVWTERQWNQMNRVTISLGHQMNHKRTIISECACYFYVNS